METDNVIRGDQGLFLAISNCARIQLFRRVDPQAVEDHVQEVLLIVLTALRKGKLRDPACLMGFVRTVTRRQVAGYIRGAIVRRKALVSLDQNHGPSPAKESPEAKMVAIQVEVEVGKILGKLCARDRNILIRFYYQEQDSERICREMNITPTQFRLYKSRALAKCYSLTDRTRIFGKHSLMLGAPLPGSAA